MSKIYLVSFVLPTVCMSAATTLFINWLTVKPPNFKYDITNPNVSWADSRALFGGDLNMLMHGGKTAKVVMGFAPDGAVVWTDADGAIGARGHMPKGGKWRWRNRDSIDKTEPKIPTLKNKE